MLSPTTLDAASTAGQAFGFGVKPQKQRLACSIAAGVFSETLDYNERAKIRPELFNPYLTLPLA
jgi:hypothetical protein